MAGWPRNDLLELLGVEHPIIQAPMASAATPALAAAVSNAGGLGSLGCAPFTPEKFAEQVGALRTDTNRAFNVNFLSMTNRSPISRPKLPCASASRLIMPN